MASPITAMLIGAGNRGMDAYGGYALAHPDEIQIVAIAEPLDSRRARFAQAHSIPAEHQFRSWEDLLAKGKIADAAVITTQDRLHAAPTIAALNAGYDVLLEKPMANRLEDCVRLVQTSERTGRVLQICHVLRYTTFWVIVHDIVASGRLGKIIWGEQRANLAQWHMAQSFVRGSWGNSKKESPIILAKTCHDLDILFWNLGPAKRVSSFGSLIHYRPENAPPGAPARCTDGCPAAETCYWYAPRIYLEMTPLLQEGRYSAIAWQRVATDMMLEHPGVVEVAKKVIPGVRKTLEYRGWPLSLLSEDTSREGLLQALKTGPWGRCVYRCDNDVVDNMVVNMELESGASVSFALHGHSGRDGRTLRYDGTKGTMEAHFLGNDEEIRVYDHWTGKTEVIRPKVGYIGATGHGGGDPGLMANFIQSVRDRSKALTTAKESLESHMMAFAAEEARVTETIVHMDEFRRRAEASASAGA